VLFDAEDGGNSANYRRMIVHLAFGENDADMTALERSVTNREALLGLISMACDPIFDALKTSPRFVPLMQRIGARACPAATTWPVPPVPPRFTSKAIGTRR
jgi:hypothetical protein